MLYEEHIAKGPTTQSVVVDEVTWACEIGEFLLEFDFLHVVIQLLLELEDSDGKASESSFDWLGGGSLF